MPLITIEMPTELEEIILDLAYEDDMEPQTFLLRIILQEDRRRHFDTRRPEIYGGTVRAKCPNRDRCREDREKWNSVYETGD